MDGRRIGWAGHPLSTSRGPHVLASCPPSAIEPFDVATAPRAEIVTMEVSRGSEASTAELERSSPRRARAPRSRAR